MKKLSELREEVRAFEYLEVFEIKEKLRELNTSCEVEYVDEKGNGTHDVHKAEITYCEDHDTCLGWYFVTIEKKRIKVYVDMYLEDWDDEQDTYTMESYDEIGWDYE